MATSTILFDLPILDNIPVASLLSDLKSARLQLATERQAAALARDNEQARMAEIDRLLAVILQCQSLLSVLVEAGLVKLDFEAVSA